jgi:hypothetical protein
MPLSQEVSRAGTVCAEVAADNPIQPIVRKLKCFMQEGGSG